MTQLYIDGHLCDLPTDFKITLVTENLYFSKASTYTYDVKLPMLPFSNNAKIFGHLNRFDKSLTTRSWPAQLIVDNKVIVNGTAVVVGITDDSISVQLLQGNSELNWKSKYGATYIDELPLGDVTAWNMTIVTSTSGGVQKSVAHPNTNIAKQDPNSGNPLYYWEQTDFAEANNGNVVITPIYNKGTGVFMNQTRPYERDWTPLWWREFFYVGCWSTHSHGLREETHYAPQPKLAYMVNLIFNQLGLNITYNELATKNWYNNAFIANSNEVVYIQQCLPHWTFEEFVNQLQLLFNCVIIVNEKNTRIYLRKNLYVAQLTAQSITLKQVIDGFETDVDTEPSVADADKSKVFDIAYPDYGTMFLGKDFADVPIVDASQLTGTRNPYVFSRNARLAKVSSPYKENNVVYGYDVDQYEPSPADTDEEVTLKMVPLLPYKTTEPIRFQYYLSADDDGHWGEYTLDVPTSFGINIDNEDVDIQTLLDSLKTPPDRPEMDKLTLGFLTKKWLQVPQGSGTFVLTHYDVFTVYTVSAQTANYEVDNIPSQPFTMSVYPRKNSSGNYIDNLHKVFYKDTPKIVVSNATVVRFQTDQIHDVIKTFLIKNQLFACKQIKYTITARGFEKIAEGTFYKL